MLYDLVRELPTEWIENFVAAFEEGRVQKHPHARFVNGRGECCLVGALAGARSGEDVVRSEVWRAFRSSSLEELSRRFERCRLTGQAFYEEAVLELTARRCVPAEPLALSV
ncbi:MAG: hypothetical protein ACREM1_19550 [Longimicrobiales bacterium]